MDQDVGLGRTKDVVNVVPQGRKAEDGTRQGGDDNMIDLGYGLVGVVSIIIAFLMVTGKINIGGWKWIMIFILILVGIYSIYLGFKDFELFQPDIMRW